MKSEYPKKMYHPNALPAVLSEGPAMGGGQGHGAHLPPVTVGGPDDEAWYVARGYVEGDQVLEPVPLRQKERENIRMRKSPEPEEPDTFEYPKYVGDKIAQSAEEEAAILAEMNKKPPAPEVIKVDRLPAVDPAELEEFRAWKAARGKVITKEDLERVEVLGMPPPPRRMQLSEEQKRRRRDNLARARAMRRKNLEAGRAP